MARSVIASSGGDAQVEGLKVSWTVGENFVETIALNDAILTQGFQQSSLHITRVTQDPLADATFDVHVYPNPATTRIQIEPKSSQIVQFKVDVYDAQGKHLTTLTAVSNEGVQTLDVSNYPAGTYALSIASGNEEPLSYQIIKIQ